MKQREKCRQKVTHFSWLLWNGAVEPEGGPPLLTTMETLEPQPPLLLPFVQWRIKGGKKNPKATRVENEMGWKNGMGPKWSRIDRESQSPKYWMTPIEPLSLVQWRTEGGKENPRASRVENEMGWKNRMGPKWSRTGWESQKYRMTPTEP